MVKNLFVIAAYHCVFDYPTPKALAQYLRSALDTGGASTTAQVRERSRTASNNEICVPARIPADV